MASRWQTITPASVSSVTHWGTTTPVYAESRHWSYFRIPAFSLTGQTWKGSSDVKLHFLYTATHPFTILRLPTAPVGVKFVPCIRWRSGTTSYRYKLWENVGESLYGSVYNGEKIGADFVIEIWNTNNAILSLANDLYCYTSILTEPVTTTTPVDIENCVATTVANYTYPASWINPLAFPVTDYWNNNT